MFFEFDNHFSKLPLCTLLSMCNIVLVSGKVFYAIILEEFPKSMKAGTSAFEYCPLNSVKAQKIQGRNSEGLPGDSTKLSSLIRFSCSIYFRKGQYIVLYLSLFLFDAVLVIDDNVS